MAKTKKILISYTWDENGYRNTVDQFVNTEEEAIKFLEGMKDKEVKTRHIPTKFLSNCVFCEDTGKMTVQSGPDDVDVEPCEHCRYGELSE